MGEEEVMEVGVGREWLAVGEEVGEGGDVVADEEN